MNHNSNQRVVARPSLNQKHLNPNLILYCRHAILLDVSHCGKILMNFESGERKCFQKCSWNLLPNELVLSFVEKSIFILFLFFNYLQLLSERKEKNNNKSKSLLFHNPVSLYFTNGWVITLTISIHFVSDFYDVERPPENGLTWKYLYLDLLLAIYIYKFFFQNLRFEQSSSYFLPGVVEVNWEALHKNLYFEVLIIIIQLGLNEWNA